MSALPFMHRQPCFRRGAPVWTDDRQAAFKRPGVGVIRFFLLWFVLAMGVAVASPLVQPQSMELVCSSGGMIKIIVQTDDGAQEMSSAQLDCPLCLLGAAPPPDNHVARAVLSLPLARATQSIPSARIAAATAAPLPARGPPLLS